MGVFSKIMTAIRGGANDVGEAIVDANAIRILEQEIRDAENNLRKAKHNLTSVMAEQMQAERKVKHLKGNITEHEGLAAKALEKGEEGLALEVAQKIASLEAELAEQQGVFEQYASQSARLKEIVKKTERTIADHKRQMSIVKTTDKVQKASAAINTNFSSSAGKLTSAKESLERIKKRQQDFEDRAKAAESLEAESQGGDLKAKLEAAGITESTDANAQSVLDRIKAKQSQ